MTVYLYGLVLGGNATRIPAHITGVGSTSVRVVDCEREGLGAIVSTVERAPLRSSIDDIRAHDHVLQSVVHHGATAAAVRFGQVFADDEDIRRHVAERGGRVARVLEQHDGCVEMRLLMTESPGAGPDERIVVEAMGPGRAYLEEVRGTSNRHKSLGLHAALGPVVRAERVEGLPSDRGVVFSHLIERANETEYRQAVAALPALADARIVGPLALYSFAEPE